MNKIIENMMWGIVAILIMCMLVLIAIMMTGFIHAFLETYHFI